MPRPAKLTAVAAPSRNQCARRLAHRYRHLDRALRRVGAWHRIIEEHHDPVTRELVERALELGDERPQRAVVFAQERENLLRLSGFRSACSGVKALRNTSVAL
jgi:hypothetical protein